MESAELEETHEDDWVQLMIPVLSKHMTGAMTTSLGILFQVLTTLPVEKLFLVSNLMKWW